MVLNLIGLQTQVAVDWIIENVYIIDKSHSIKVCHMQPRDCITLIEFYNGERIKSLVIDALNHHFFYLAVKRIKFTVPKSTTYSKNLDGSEQLLVTKESFFTVNSVQLSHQTRVLREPRDKTIWSVKYDGAGKQPMIAASEFITWPIEINAYASNTDSNIVAKCQLHGDGRCTAFPLNANQPDNLVIVQTSRQKTGVENVCENNKYYLHTIRFGGEVHL